MMFVYLVIIALIAIVVVKLLLSPSEQSQRQPTKQEEKLAKEETENIVTDKIEDDPICIVYASQKGASKKYATQLLADANELGIKANLFCASKLDPDELLSNYSAFIFIVSTYTDGKPTQTGEAFYNWLEDTANDFRVPKSLYGTTRYAIFGCGNSQYADNFNAVARNMDSFFRKLTARHVIPVGMGDEDSTEMDSQFKTWSKTLFRVVKRIIQQREKKRKGKKREQIRAHLAKEESISADEEESGEMLEVEDVGNMMPGSGSLVSGSESYMSDEESSASEVQIHNKDEYLARLTKPMLSTTTRKSLEHQGYKIIGSHSGVKLCRWTKSMLRGRGGCYKYTFYGIVSYQCMEMTPSLACANKCVFCWRHHTNPVGKHWKWKVDKPEMLVEGAVENHQKMIKSLKGVQGVIPARFAEAQKIQHCALSLVGEPILYPYINEFIDLLHEKKISSFLVTNAQFPEKMEDLKPVTQLYLSIDAATKESLKKIDRPLFSDFWERFISSIQLLKQKGQRTVFRLTLVKSYNMEELKNYSELIKLGCPDFIEVKGVTFCGDSDASDLTIKNTPFHDEVADFCRELTKYANEVMDNPNVEYEIACEHKHSLCVLIANKKKFKIDGQWNTWIDYPKFHALIESGKSFSAEDYMAPTPSWAITGSPEEGFSPNESRFKRLKSTAPTQGC